MLFPNWSLNPGPSVSVQIVDDVMLKGFVDFLYFDIQVVNNNNNKHMVKIEFKEYLVFWWFLKTRFISKIQNEKDFRQLQNFITKNYMQSFLIYYKKCWKWLFRARIQECNLLFIDCWTLLKILGSILIELP